MSAPDVRFYRFVPGARAPQRADRTADGTLPIRAVRYCESLCSATSFGWWLFCPVDCWVLTDGTVTHWSLDREAWEPLQDACNFPGFPGEWDAQVPPHLAGKCPPFLMALEEHGGLLQVQLGLMARAAPGWGLLIRRPANFPLMAHVDHFEGIIEPRSWFGPIFINLRITKTNEPIRLRADRPLAVMQPIPSEVYGDQVLSDMRMVAADLADFEEPEWADYSQYVATPNSDSLRPYGGYGAKTRRCRKRAAAATTS